MQFFNAMPISAVSNGRNGLNAPGFSLPGFVTGLKKIIFRGNVWRRLGT